MPSSSHKNIQINGKHNKPILLDVFLTEEKTTYTLIFCHGFKGFKDWGTFNLLAEFFAENGVNCIKFNFSHNGSTPEHPEELTDMEAFGNNNFTKELDDLDTVLNWMDTQNDFPEINSSNNITVMGHSRGSGTAIVKASEDSRIDKVISFAGVSNFSARFIDKKTYNYWKSTGVIHVENTRTKQKLPLYYQIAEDIYKNPERLNIERAAKSLNKPHLIIHGTEDAAVPVEEAKAVHSWSTNSELKIIEGADHVFNVKHPWNEDKLPDDYLEILSVCLNFIKKSI
jgi:uncharacterized protein